MGLWTRVRLPPNPLDNRYTNPSSNTRVSVFGNVFGIIIELSQPPRTKEYALTFGGIIHWVYDHYGVQISRSTITQVRNKCGLNSLETKGEKEIVLPNLKSEKEKMVIEAFKNLGIV